MLTHNSRELQPAPTENIGYFRHDTRRSTLIRTRSVPPTSVGPDWSQADKNQQPAEPQATLLDNPYIEPQNATIPSRVLYTELDR